DRMEGTTTIGRISSFWPGPITIHDVVVRDPKGRLALRLDRTELWVRPLPFISGGDVIVYRGRIRGSEVRLVETRSGKLTIELAFDGPDRVVDRRVVSMKGIHFMGSRLVIDPEDVPAIVLDDAEGFGRLERTPEQRVKLRVDRMTANWVKPTPPGIDIEIERMEGWLNSKAAQSFELSTIGEANNGRFALELRYFPHRKPGMQVHYQAFDRKLTNLLAAVGLEAIVGRSDKVESIIEMPERRGQTRREERRERREERRESRSGG
ncbi:MAG: hypothetical protein H5U40_19305, partial [Polyangiaceae bacterium]|nr:hypothetical protein [Polyangiaceae bacterium]